MMEKWFPFVSGPRLAMDSSPCVAGEAYHAHKHGKAFPGKNTWQQGCISLFTKIGGQRCRRLCVLFDHPLAHYLE